MIGLRRVEITGQATAGQFAGGLDFGPGLQVISAHNAYGKSLIVKCIAWCLALEPIFGSPDSDPVIFPEAVRENISLEGHANSPVLSSEGSISLEDDSGRQLEIRRDIKGGDRTVVRVRETNKNGKTRISKLMARKSSMVDETGGFQRFLFEWLGWPLVDVPTNRMSTAKVYLENLAPLFYIDQIEGWTEIQSMQISRYGQQEISEVAVEYLLGAMGGVEARVNRVLTQRRIIELKDGARRIAESINQETLRRGWRVEWSSHGTVEEVAKRWEERSVWKALKEDAHIDLDSRRKDVSTRISKLQKALVSEPIDQKVSSAPIEASQKAIGLKRARHALNEDLSTLNLQLRDASSLLSSLEHRIHAATDLLRLKTTGVGRLDHLECPTCHRDLDAELFGLTEQSARSVQSHIESLKSDRELMIRNRDSLAADVQKIMAKGAEIDLELRNAERALTTVTTAVGPLREQLAVTAAELTAAEREAERLEDAAAEINTLQQSVERWIADARASTAPEIQAADIDEKLDAFTDSFRKYLVALGHTEVNSANAQQVIINKEDYVPYMNGRRLRGLGSASDQPRLIAAYSLALAGASGKTKGNHPGLVVLDEPLQQNPDPGHRKQFLEFLEKQIAQASKFQTLLFTSLDPTEIDRLRKKGTTVLTPEGAKLLKLVEGPKREGQTKVQPEAPGKGVISEQRERK